MDTPQNPRPFGWPRVHEIVGMKQSTRISASCVAIFILTLAIMLIGIQSPGKLYFDEVHYIPAAREILSGAATTNAEHPPLAKELMAVGIVAFGDNPLGWRFMSAVFGAFALVGIYLWSLALFTEEKVALWATAITFSNQALYVQSRIAMLDIFAVAFMVWALAAFTATWLPYFRDQTKSLLIATGAFIALSIACKWSGILCWLLVVGIAVLIKILQGWRTQFEEPAESDWYRRDLWRGIEVWDWLLCLILIPLGIYWITFSPLGWRELLPGNLLDAQITIWHENATLTGTHPYMSSWVYWPIIARPIWYFFEGSKWDTSDASAQAVLFLGNPLVFWGGILAVFACLYGWLAHRRKEAFLIVAAYSAFYIAWAVIPRTLEFSFYYLPAAMTLGVALAYAFYRTPLNRWPWTRRLFLAACVLMFGYFLPISNAVVTASEPEFNRLMWFERWR